MRMSCNGCRVLRKGCSEDCSIRPCLEWISCPESQANATVFLAKFYGRAGLVNLVDAGPRHLRPAIFKSLLYEACGRIVSPISGSVGLISSGDGQLCHDAVEAVLKGDPITRMDTEFMEVKNWPSLVAGDIRHINKHGNLSDSKDLHRVRTRCNLKRSASKSKPRRVWIEDKGSNEKELSRSLSHDSSLSQQSEMSVPELEPPCEAPGSPEPEFVQSGLNTNSDGEIELDLTLSLEPAKRCAKPAKAGGSRKMGLRLDCSVS